MVLLLNLSNQIKLSLYHVGAYTGKRLAFLAFYLQLYANEIGRYQDRLIKGMIQEPHYKFERCETQHEITASYGCGIS